MVIFNLPQFERECSWQYLSRLNDYRAQYVHFTYKKLKIYDVVLEGITDETRTSLSPCVMAIYAFFFLGLEPSISLEWSYC